MKTVTGRNGIKATVLAHSINKAGKPLIAWEIEYPRLVLAELNTHRQLSRNSFSSRAVPFVKMLGQLIGEPVRFGANQPGMQDKGEDFDAPVRMITEEDYDDHKVLFSKQELLVPPRQAWQMIKAAVIELTRGFVDAGYHKQVYNRLLEPWQMMKSVVSATEIDNFFWLRDDDAADPTLHELARVMRQAMNESEPEFLLPGEWHLPYIDVERIGVKRHYSILDDTNTRTYLSVENAIKVSCARCAAVSYRNEGYGLEKSLQIYADLVGGIRKHASAFEHCATPMVNSIVFNGERFLPEHWELGVSHLDRNGRLWSGNFQGWIQFRKTIPDECYNAS